MIVTVAILALVGAAQEPVALPQGGQVKVELAADRDIYYVGEPVRLTLTVKNTGAEPLFGYMVLRPYLPRDLQSSMLTYCRTVEPCAEFLGSIRNAEEKELEVTPTTLEPGRQQQSGFVVALNPQNGALVLGTAGDYEFRWVTWGIHEARKYGPRVRGAALSASAFIRVLPVPKAEQAAHAFYVESKLALMAQYDEAYGEYTDDLRLAAHAMLSRYPNSLYSDAVRAGFMAALESRVRRGRATREDHERLAELRARAAGR